LVGEQGAACCEVVAAQSDGFGRPAAPGVAIGEVVDQSGVDGGEVLGLPDAALGPVQGFGCTTAVSSSRAMSRWV
jgi:hypothetical protein